MTEAYLNSVDDEQTGVIGHYNPVRVQDTLGVIILGAIAIVLLIALLRAQGRTRSLLTELAQMGNL
jgi:hypothetical protein